MLLLCYGCFLKNVTYLGLDSCLSKHLQFFTRLPCPQGCSRGTTVPWSEPSLSGTGSPIISWCSCWPLPVSSIAREWPFLFAASIPGFSALFTCWVEGLGTMTSPLIRQQEVGSVSAGVGSCQENSKKPRFICQNFMSSVGHVLGSWTCAAVAPHPA